MTCRYNYSFPLMPLTKSSYLHILYHTLNFLLHFLTLLKYNWEMYVSEIYNIMICIWVHEITAIKLITTLSPHLVAYFLILITLKIYCLNKFQEYNTMFLAMVLLTLVNILCSILGLQISFILKLKTGILWSTSPIPPTLSAPGNHHYTLCFYEFNFRFRIRHSVSGMFHLA